MPVVDLLDPQRVEKDDGFVFQGTVEGKPLVGFPKLWKKLFKDTALANVTPHVLRHSFTSIANDLGFTEATIGTLVGHSRDSVTGRYIHTIDTLLVMAARTRWPDSSKACLRVRGSARRPMRSIVLLAKLRSPDCSSSRSRRPTTVRISKWQRSYTQGRPNITVYEIAIGT